MTRASSPMATRLAWRACLALTILLLVGNISMAPADLGVWLAAFPVAAWQAGPLVLAALCVDASRTDEGQVAFMVCGGAYALFMLFNLVEIIRSTSSTAPIGLIVNPVFGYAGWLGFLIIALVMGWRGKEGWPSPKS